MQDVRWLAIAVVIAGCGKQAAKQTREMEIVRAPHCAPGHALVHPIAVFASSGSMKYYGVHTGTAASTRVTFDAAQREVTLKFGICPTPVGGTMYSCAPHAHDGVRYYAERKVVVDPALPRAELVEPTAPNALLCSDGKQATF